MKEPVRREFCPTRLEKGYLFDADVYREDLTEPIWQADLVPINAAKLACDWISGVQIRKLESSLPQLSAGMLHEVYRNLAWTLQGFAAVITAASDIRIPMAFRPEGLRGDDDKVRFLARLASLYSPAESSSIRRLARRCALDVGAFVYKAPLYD